MVSNAEKNQEKKGRGTNLPHQEWNENKNEHHHKSYRENVKAILLQGF